MFLNVTISVPNLTAAQLNSLASIDSTKPHEGVSTLLNILNGINGGLLAAELDLAITNVDPSVSAAGGGDSGTYNLL